MSFKGARVPSPSNAPRVFRRVRLVSLRPGVIPLSHKADLVKRLVEDEAAKAKPEVNEGVRIRI